jgi:hypothetical protein
MDVVHAFALTWDLRDEVNLPLLFIEDDGADVGGEGAEDGGDGADDRFLFLVCTSAGGVANHGDQIRAARTRTQLKNYFEIGPFQYVIENTIQARHFIINAVVKSHKSGDVRVIANLLVTLQHYDVEDEEESSSEEESLPEEGSLPVVDYTGMIDAVLTKEWGGVWKFRKLIIHMDVTIPAANVIFRGR